MGILGIFTLLSIAYLLSNNKEKINYNLVIRGLSIQLIFALLILKSPLGKPLFTYLDGAITKLINNHRQIMLLVSYIVHPDAISAITTIFSKIHLLTLVFNFTFPEIMFVNLTKFHQIYGFSISLLLGFYIKSYFH